MKKGLFVLALSVAFSQFASAGPKVGDNAICDIKLKMSSPDGATVEKVLCDGDGKAVVLKFFATWCAPCVESLPGFMEEAKTYGNVAFRLVSMDSDRSTVDSFFTSRNRDNVEIAYDTSDTGSKAGGAYEVNYLPSMVVIGKDRKIKYSDIDTEVDEAAFEAALKKAAGE